MGTRAGVHSSLLTLIDCRAAISQVEHSKDGLAALVFTSEGDMRQAINNLQSTWTGLGFVSPDNVFKVCDQPHPITIRAMLNACYKGDIEKAMDKLDEVWNLGYAAVDIVTTIFRVVKTMDSIPEAIKVGIEGKKSRATVHRSGKLTMVS